MSWFAQFSRRHVWSASIIIIVEVYLYRQYAHLGAEFHFWLHGLLGASIGLLTLTVWRLLTRRAGRISPWEAGVLGHLYSMVPDILFITFGLLHVYWMDVFAFHIRIHFIHQPVISMLTVFCFSLLAYALSQSGKKRGAVWAGGLAITILLGSLLLSSPVPQNLSQIQRHSRHYAWLCPMWDESSI